MHQMHKQIAPDSRVVLCGAELAERNVPRFSTTRMMDVTCQNCLTKLEENEPEEPTCRA